MTFQSSSNDLLLISKYLVSSSASGGKYTTIQGAINAAIADGASTANPLDVIIKAGTYTENLTLADGVNLVSLEFSAKLAEGAVVLNPTSSVVINGTHSISSGIINIYGIKFIKTNTTVFNITGGSVNFGFCIAEVVNATIFNLSTTTSKNILMSNCHWEGDSASKFITHTSANAALSVSGYGVNIIGMNVLSNILNTGSISWLFENSRVQGAFTCTATSGAWVYKNCSCFDNGVDEHITLSYTSAGSLLRFHRCDLSVLNGTFFIDLSGATNCGLGIQNCRSGTSGAGAGPLTWNISSAVSIECIDYSQQGFSTTINAEKVFSGYRVGYRNSAERKTQKFVQTTNATATTIWSYTLPTNRGITIQGIISGKISDSSAYCGGFFLGSARRAGAGAILVGTPTILTQEDSASAPTFAINVSGNDLRLQVIGVAAQTWNWAATVVFQPIETNA